MTQLKIDLKRIRLTGGKRLNEKQMLENIQRNGETYQNVMGKFQAEMKHIPPRHWLKIVELCVFPLDDVKAAWMDALIEELRCAKCSHIGRACTCGGNASGH